MFFNLNYIYYYKYQIKIFIYNLIKIRKLELYIKLRS